MASKRSKFNYIFFLSKWERKFYYFQIVLSFAQRRRLISASFTFELYLKARLIPPNIKDENSGSQTFLSRGTLGELYQYLAAPIDAKIGLKFNKSDKWRHPRHYLKAPRMRTTGLESKEGCTKDRPLQDYWNIIIFFRNSICTLSPL